MKFFIIRHGLTELNKQKKVNGEVDEPLAPEGIKQAREAFALLPKSIKHIYTSPMKRTRETAEILNSKLKCSITAVDELTEIRMGSLAGNAWLEMEGGLELKQKHRSIRFDYRPYGGESAKEVKRRVISFLKKIQGKHQSNEVLIITHGGIIRTITLLAGGGVITEDIQHISLHTFDLNLISGRIGVQNEKNRKYK